MRDFIYEKLMKWIYIAAYVICVFFDIRYLVKWNYYGETESAVTLFIPLMLFHTVFLILALIWKKKGKAPSGSILLLLILGAIAVMSINTAHTMTKYVYKSRYGTYDKTIDDFKQNSIMKVSSNSLIGDRWSDDITNTEKGMNLTPQLSFDTVAGASYYVIYMVDESANNWVHWYAEVTQPELAQGANPGLYIGPYPPEGSGDHTYTVYVYALADKPAGNFTSEYPEFDKPWFGGDNLWTVLNTKDVAVNPVLYGNVIAYGYVSGTYSR